MIISNKKTNSVFNFLVRPPNAINSVFSPQSNKNPNLAARSKSICIDCCLQSFPPRINIDAIISSPGAALAQSSPSIQSSLSAELFHPRSLSNTAK